MKRSLPFVILISIFLSISLYSQTKRVLLEQHTGAWCGWCVDGTVIMDSILKMYPDQVIGIKVHNGDSMAIPVQSEIAGALGLTGYPTAAIDRKAYSGNVFLSRSIWVQNCTSAIQAAPRVDVQLKYFIDRQNRRLYAKVSARMLDNVNLPLRFNVYVLEDSVSGAGTGWDQSNYLSGRAGYENNPYYKLPSIIKGYQHMKVVRTMLGGAWGLQGSFAVPAQKDMEYSCDFNAELDPSWDLDKLWFVGLVQVDAPNSKEILNCIVGTEGEPSMQLVTTGIKKDVIASGNTLKLNLNLKNNTASGKNYKFDIVKSSRTPSEWHPCVKKDDAEFSLINLSPGESADVSFELTPSQTIGIGDATLEITDRNNPDAFKGIETITCYSSEIQDFQILNSSQGKYSLSAILIDIGYGNIAELSLNEFMDFKDRFPVKKSAIWNTGASSSFNSDQVNEILNEINQNTNVFVCGNMTISSLYNANALTLFGAEYNGYSTQGYGSSPWRVWLSGVEGDPITSEFGNTFEGNLIQYLINLMKITDSEKTHPIMHFKYDGKYIVVNGGQRDTLDIKGADAIFGSRVQFDNSRAVLLSITPYVIVNQNIRQKLIKNILDWMNNSGGEISVNVNTIKFGVVLMGEERESTIAVRNYGKANLTVNSLNIQGADSYVFELVTQGSLPWIIEPNSSHLVTIKFKPTAEAQYKAELLIISDDKLNPNLKVPIEGNGVLTDVDDPNCMYPNLSLFPNPVNDRIFLECTLDHASSLDITITNSFGTSVAQLCSEYCTAGNYSKEFAISLPAGMYFIKVKNGDKILSKPFIVVK